MLGGLSAAVPKLAVALAGLLIFGRVYAEQADLASADFEGVTVDGFSYAGDWLCCGG